MKKKNIVNIILQYISLEFQLNFNCIQRFFFWFTDNQILCEISTEMIFDVVYCKIVKPNYTIVFWAFYRPVCTRWRFCHFRRWFIIKLVKIFATRSWYRYSFTASICSFLQPNCEFDDLKKLKIFCVDFIMAFFLTHDSTCSLKLNRFVWE